MSNSRRRRSFKSCVREDYSECQTKHAFQLGAIPFFCGQSKICMVPCQAALDKAIDNVNKYYGVVGLTEDFMHTFALFEQTSPKMFSNLTNIASDILLEDKRRMTAKKHYKKDPKIVQMMSQRMQLENQFYEYVKKRFYAFVIHYKTDLFLDAKFAEIKAKADTQKKLELEDLQEQIKLEKQRLESEKQNIKAAQEQLKRQKAALQRKVKAAINEHSRNVKRS